eukprot:gene37986-62809_t
MALLVRAGCGGRRPCRYHNTPTGCARGSACFYAHHAPQGEQQQQEGGGARRGDYDTADALRARLRAAGRARGAVRAAAVCDPAFDAAMGRFRDADAAKQRRMRACAPPGPPHMQGALGRWYLPTVDQPRRPHEARSGGFTCANCGRQ